MATIIITENRIGETITGSIVFVRPPATLYNCVLYHVKAFSGTVVNCIRVGTWGSQTKSGSVTWDSRDIHEKIKTPLPEGFWGSNSVKKTIVPSSPSPQEEKRDCVPYTEQKAEPEYTCTVTDAYGNHMTTQTHQGAFSVLGPNHSSSVYNQGGLVFSGAHHMKVEMTRE